MINLIKKLHNINLDKFFYIGIFLLPSAPSISAIILLIAGIFATFKRKNSFFNDLWNFPFILMSALMIVSSFIITNQSGATYLNFYDTKLTWLGLSNWIPYFWIFWSLQYFSFQASQRKKIGLTLLSGSVPVLFTGILQYFFGINGPFIFLNGLIIWFSKPIDSFNGLSGLFSNANYTGTWLNIALPFSLVFFLEKKDKIFEKIISILFLFSIVVCTIFTLSRNALLGLIIGLLLILGISILRWLIPFLISICVPIFLSLGKIKNDFLIEYSRNIVPSVFWDYKLANIGFENLVQYSRLLIWKNSLIFILEKPLFGWGAASFPILYEMKTGFYNSHSHNLFMELAISYGLLVAIIFSITVAFIILYSFKKNINNKIHLNPYDKAWQTSLILILSNQMFDIQYFDIRVGLIFWILLGGLRNFIK